MRFQALKKQLSSLLGRDSASAASLEAGLEMLEEGLIQSDVSFKASGIIADCVGDLARKKGVGAIELSTALKVFLAQKLQPLSSPPNLVMGHPEIWLICGINGAGKTTTIGKLAYHFSQKQQKRVMVAAADNFRAAAAAQLERWADTAKVSFFGIKDAAPSTVAFSSAQNFLAKGLDLLLIDTAGRLHSQLHLIEELKKIEKVLKKAIGDSADTVAIKTILVVDGHTGQNMLTQLKVFSSHLTISGLIITKLDGLARGGAIISLAVDPDYSPLPVYFIGNGEGVNDLTPFSPQQFVSSIF